MFRPVTSAIFRLYMIYNLISEENCWSIILVHAGWEAVDVLVWAWEAGVHGTICSPSALWLCHAVYIIMLILLCRAYHGHVY
jgi:hypothetical protein